MNDPAKICKYPLFAGMGQRYPKHLEARYERIIIKIEELWNSREIHDYFSDLLIDKRGGRAGFPHDVLQDIIALREFREIETFRAAEHGTDAASDLARRGVHLKAENLYDAIEAGSQELVDLFVRAKFDIHKLVDDKGVPPLVAALKKGYTVVAKILLNGGADVNAHDPIGLTPLLVACGKTTNGFKWIAEALLRRGALVNVRDGLGNTPLMLAISGGNLEIARMLLANGADVARRTRRGETALSLAMAIDTPEGRELVEALMQRGAEPDPGPGLT